jgi:hypothetical protein
MDLLVYRIHPYILLECHWDAGFLPGSSWGWRIGGGADPVVTYYLNVAPPQDHV